MSDKSNVLIIGPGAVGSFYGAMLKRAGCSVSVVVRSDYDAVAADGFVMDSPLGDLSWRPDRVYHTHDTPPATATPPDYVLLCVKVLPSIDRVALVRPWLGAHTRLVLIENGFAIEPELAAAYPQTPLISCIAVVAVSRNAPGHVTHSGYGRLVMGQYPQGVGTACRELAAWFEAGDVSVKLSEHITGERWKKCVWNTALNPLAVLAGGADTTTMLDAPGGEALVRALMAEVCAVAAADGYPLSTDRVVDASIEGTRNMPGFRNSMAQDYVNGRPIELDAILGNVVAVARQHGVAVPRLQTILATLRMRGF